MENRNTGDLKKLYYTVNNFENNWPFFSFAVKETCTVIIIIIYFMSVLFFYDEALLKLCHLLGVSGKWFLGRVILEALQYNCLVVLV